MAVGNLLEVPQLRSGRFGDLPSTGLTVGFEEGAGVHAITIIADCAPKQVLYATRARSQIAIQSVMEYKAARRFNLMLLEAEFGSLAEIARQSEHFVDGDEGPVTASYLSQIKGGRSMGDKLARKLERLHPELGSNWMDKPQAPQPPRPAALSNENVVEVPRAKFRLPLISWVSAGLSDEANDPYAPGNAEDWIDFDGPASSSAFCLRVRGRSMESPDGKEPHFPDGCLIAVEPRRRPLSGDCAVFRFNDRNEATFKQYIESGDLRLLKPLNPDPEYKIYTIGPDAQLVGTVFEMRVVRKY